MHAPTYEPTARVGDQMPTKTKKKDTSSRVCKVDSPTLSFKPELTYEFHERLVLKRGYGTLFFCPTVTLGLPRVEEQRDAVPPLECYGHARHLMRHTTTTRVDVSPAVPAVP